MAQSIDDTQASSAGQASRLMELASTTNTTLSDEFLLDSLRKSAQITIRHIRTDFVEVANASRVLGYVTRQQDGYVALKGDDPAWAHEVGSYTTEALAIEALRMRKA